MDMEKAAMFGAVSAVLIFLLASYLTPMLSFAGSSATILTTWVLVLGAYYVIDSKAGLVKAAEMGAVGSLVATIVAPLLLPTVSGIAGLGPYALAISTGIVLIVVAWAMPGHK